MTDSDEDPMSYQGEGVESESDSDSDSDTDTNKDVLDEPVEDSNISVPENVDMDDIPTNATTEQEVDIPEEHNVTTFNEFNLDPRLLRAIAKLHFNVPTAVQASCIPLILDGKDVLARAKTGSGKTAAYLVPILQSLLSVETLENKSQALILVPTKELSEQVTQTLNKLCQYSAKAIKSINLADSTSDAVQKSTLLEGPHMVISTPSRALLHIRASNLQIDALRYLVIDEADLVLSYGYNDDINALSKIFPRGIQTIMMSATLDAFVDSLKSTLCRNPVVLRLKEIEAGSESLIQYYVKCAEEEKFLLTYVILKLQLIKGKILIFVNDVDRCYRLRLFLEQFGIRSCVLNSELPVNSRGHIVDEFNKGVYDIIIAADDNDAMGPKLESDDEQLPTVPKKKADSKNKETTTAPPSKKRKRQAKSDTEFGVSRGVDFRNVACVLNFDLPQTTRSYVHRIGRTARAGRSGMAMSFTIPAEKFGLHKSTSLPSCKSDEKTLAKIMADQSNRGNELKLYGFNMTQVAAFRYRMEDALRAVTKTSIRDARAKELRAELLNSEKLKEYLAERPEVLATLRHDREIHVNRTQAHLKRVPEYIKENLGIGASKVASADVGFVGFKSDRPNRSNGTRGRGGGRGGRSGRGGTARGRRGKRSDPLKSFK